MEPVKMEGQGDMEDAAQTQEQKAKAVDESVICIRVAPQNEEDAATADQEDDPAMPVMKIAMAKTAIPEDQEM